MKVTKIVSIINRYKHVLFAVLATLFIFHVPYLPVENLDASWQLTLEDALSQGWQFGTQIVYTGGPLSILYAPTSMGTMLLPQMLLEALLLGTLCYILFRQLKGRAAWWSALLFCGVVTLTFISKDGLFLSCIGVIAINLLNPKLKKKLRFLFVFILALVALIKFSLMLLGAACMAIVFISLIWQKQYMQLLITHGVWIITILLLWVLTGQSLGNFPSYLINSWAVSSGYLWAMANYESLFQFASAALTLGAALFLYTYVFWKSRLGTQAFAKYLILIGTSLFAWKAGIIRPSSHSMIFVHVCYFLLLITIAKSELPRRFSQVAALCVSTGFFLSLMWFSPVSSKDALALVLRVPDQNIQALIHPVEFRDKFLSLINIIKKQHSLHEMSKVIGDEAVDLFDDRQAVLFISDLNYQPRPTIQGYTAYTPQLAKLNVEHMRKSQPPFVIIHCIPEGPVFPFAADNLYFKELYKYYKPLMEENEYLLLSRQTDTPTTLEETHLLTKSVSINEKIDLSEYDDLNLWLKINYTPHLLHQSLAFFHKPEYVGLDIYLSNGEKRRARLVSKNLKNGLLLSPYLNSNNELSTFLKTGTSGQKVVGFEIISFSPIVPFKTRKFEVEVYEIKREH